MKNKTMITVAGELVEIGEVQTFGKFQKRTAVVKVEDGKYPSFFQFTFKGGELGIIDGYAVGDVVTISGFVNGTKWQKKDADGKPAGKVMYFLEIAAKTVESGAGSSDDGQGEADYPVDCSGADDDIPF